MLALAILELIRSAVPHGDDGQPLGRGYTADSVSRRLILRLFGGWAPGAILAGPGALNSALAQKEAYSFEQESKSARC